MKYLLRPAGDHSNRLFQLAHIVAYCQEYNEPLAVLCFDDMAALYNDGGYCIPKHHKIKSAVWTFLDKVRQKTKLPLLKAADYSDDNAMTKLPPESLPKNCIIDGWHFRVHHLTEKYRQFIADKYSLKEQYYKDSGIYIYSQSLDPAHYLKVGVHIRRGDYKDFLGGKYYYENDVFASYMRQFCEAADKVGKKVKFFLFSNEPIAPLFTQQFDAVVSNNPWYIDQFLMTQADYLIGPPSTFTGWASYISQTPLFFIETKDTALTLEDFHVING